MRSAPGGRRGACLQTRRRTTSRLTPLSPIPLSPRPLQKWSKGKVREKLANLVLFDQKALDRLNAEVPKMKLVTISAVSERLKIGGSLARAGIQDLVKKGALRVVAAHSKMPVYSKPSAE
jgi:small subunit ribosomal protein S25e